MGDSRKSDLALLFSLAALPMAGCSAGVEDGPDPFVTATNATTNPTASSTASSGDSNGDDTGDDSASGPNDSGGDPSTASASGPSSASSTMGSSDPSASASDPSGTMTTYGGTYGGSYGESYGGSYGGSYGSYGGSYGSYGESGGGMVPPVCQQFAQNYANCNPMGMYSPEDNAYYCADELMYAAMIGGQCGTALEEFYACMSMANCQELNGNDPCFASELDGVCGGGP